MGDPQNATPQPEEQDAAQQQEQPPETVEPETAGEGTAEDSDYHGPPLKSGEDGTHPASDYHG